MSIENASSYTAAYLTRTSGCQPTSNALPEATLTQQLFPQRHSTAASSKMFSFFVLLLLLCFSACSTQNLAPEDNDPIETVNRGVFWFNDKVDIYLLEPVAKGYDFVVPDPAQTGISNFINNLETPIRLCSDLIQLKFEQFGVHLARFVVNSTVGLLGFIDVAKTQGLEPHYEDLSTAFASLGIPEGPYLVLPFLGPSHVRHAVGRTANGFIHPSNYLSLYFDNAVHSTTADAIALGYTGLEVIHTRAQLIDAIETAKESSLDYYAFVRAAYFQRRRSLVNDGATPAEEEFDEDSFDDEAFEDDDFQDEDFEDEGFDEEASGEDQ